MTAYSIPTEFLNTNPNSKATFRPGGDAAYVSYLLGGIINEIADFTDSKLGEGETFATYIERVTAQEAANLGFSEALKAKFLRAADRVLQRELDRQERELIKAARKAAKTAKARREVIEIIDYAEGIKVGRWVYPAREIKYSDDTELVQRNAKRDGSGEWIDLP
uniref:MazG-like nucleotide pyrophosphohydrolase n=1 Tax=Micrococcus phage Olihed TaxID=3092209 RepID=A0AAU6R646_9CAUD